MKKTLLLVLVGLFYFSFAQLQAQTNEDISIGKRISFDSEIYGNERELMISLPEEYDESKTYPVLYVLYPQYSFERVYSAARDLGGSNGIPELIIVGICDDGSRGDVFPFKVTREPGNKAEGKKFIESIKKEVIPYIEKEYKTDSQRIVVGFSNTGMLATYILNTDPDLFSSYILSSPMLGYENNYVLNQTTELFKAIETLNKNVYIVYGENDFSSVMTTMPSLRKLLENSAPKGLKWKMEELKGEGHVPYTDVYRGIEFIFEDVEEIQQTRTIFTLIRDGNIEEVKDLVKQNPNIVDSTNSGYTPLIFAVYYKNMDIVDLLLKNNADVNYQNPATKIDALNMSLRHRDLSLIKKLVKNGANINAQNDRKETALHIAVRSNSNEISEYLINAGVDLNLVDDNDKTALVTAIESNNKEIADLILAKGAEFPEDKQEINKLLHISLANGQINISKALISKCTDFDDKDEIARSFLHNAVIGGDFVSAKKLVEKGADINVVDSLSKTALHYSIMHNNKKLTKLLIDEDTDINAIDNTGRTATSIAQDWGHKDILDYLKSKGGKLSKERVVKFDGEGKAEIKVTYIANMGYMISSADKTVLVDALFEQGFNSYLTPSKQIVNKLNKQEEPFHSADIMLITHDHGDHFSPEMVAEYMSNSDKLNVICNSKTSERLKIALADKADTSRVKEIMPDLYKSISTKASGIDVKVFRLRHADGNGTSENLGYLFNLEGMNIFIGGDACGRAWEGTLVSGEKEYDLSGIKNSTIDLAIINRGFLWGEDAPGIEILKKHLKPKHIILGHFSSFNKDGEDEVLQTIEKLKASLPDVTILEESMQSIIIKSK
ncbi:MAG: ankyrin repeat domain-containing protein [Candidatus Cloacimonetes bacterium]|nr:ankyrin repeat domain-containing protein [Candidatus Cloacimonadota bacterium]MCF7813329.1 ankyrin repeat domain-containing protein [Candidatus Cloacimonadota bacterium]MCF7867818.1 ankyrin repeat domain-containing protein [Candidatus Cloacimonadota bacterium]MCF7883296.1 ankyrin repeat domain-containing protein [Candidatus Cloacimonadota bacterium]